MADDAGAPDGELTEESGDDASAEETVTAAAADADQADEAEEADAVEGVAAEDAKKPRISHLKLALIAGIVLVLALGGLTGWLGYSAYNSVKAKDQRDLFLQVGRQGAINLTTIDWEHADADVQRVLDSATGTFYDDFQQRAQPFIAVVKQAKSKSVGSITEAGIESESGDEGQVLVAVTVQTSNAGAPEQQPRAWRMRISVKKDGDDNAKVSNVEFVP
jgi:Mce-associated membrane protein